MPSRINLPHADGSLQPYSLTQPPAHDLPATPSTSRKVFAAAHVVADPLHSRGDTSAATLDWDATLAYRRYLWSLGLGVAEAMDTAQRGMGLDWPTTRELIRSTLGEAAACGGLVACGAGTDHLEPNRAHSLSDIEAAYARQCETIESCGGDVILMASRALAAAARQPGDYAEVYGRLLANVERPVILHWLGSMFDPALEGYWGSNDLDLATQSLLDIIHAHADKVEGVKISLLDKRREIDLRRRVPPGVRVYTGDDFHYPELIRGDEQGHSDALLGIFDAIAPVAAAAIHALDCNQPERYAALLEPTVALSRHIFEPPTFCYKTGIVFMAYLNGHQTHFRMVGGLESARSVLHLSRLFVLADQAGLLRDPELAVARMKAVLAVAGLDEA